MRNPKTKVSLKESDWQDLFPGREYTLGTTKFYIYPLSLESISFIATKIGTIGDKFTKLNLDFSDLGTESVGVVDFVRILLNEVPEVLSEMSGVEVEDIKGLPLLTAVQLFNACLDVNIESQDSLIKNFKELGAKFKKFTQGEEQTQPAIEKNSIPAPRATH